MQRFLIVPLFLAAGLISCKKDPEIRPVVKPEPYLLIDSVAGSKATVSVFEPAVTVKGQNSTATFTLDINEDGNGDYEIINYQATQLGIASSERSRIRSLHADAWVRVDSFYYMTTNYYTAGNIVNTTNSIRDSLFAKVMKEKDTLHLNDKYSQGSVFISASSVNGSQQILGSESFDNAWYNKDRRYVGLKLQGVLCWVRMSALKGAGITVYSYGKKK